MFVHNNRGYPSYFVYGGNHCLSKWRSWHWQSLSGLARSLCQIYGNSESNGYISGCERTFSNHGPRGLWVNLTL